MRKAVALPIIVVLSVIIGGLFYLYGGPAFHPQSTGNGLYGTPTSIPTANSVVVLGKGSSAAGFDQRVNYRITDADQLTVLWQMVYGNNGPTLPNIDFSKNEVLAVFDGSHSTGGYGIEVTSVKDVDGTRNITITHKDPGTTCITTRAVSSPFAIVQVRASLLPVTHIDETKTTQCP